MKWSFLTYFVIILASCLSDDPAGLVTLFQKGKKCLMSPECPIDQVLFPAVILEMDRVMVLIHPLLFFFFGLSLWKQERSTPFAEKGSFSLRRAPRAYEGIRVRLTVLSTSF